MTHTIVENKYAKLIMAAEAVRIGWHEMELHELDFLVERLSEALDELNN